MRAVCGARLASCSCATMATFGMRLLATAALLPTFSAVDNGVGLTPPMGCELPTGSITVDLLSTVTLASSQRTNKFQGPPHELHGWLHALLHVAGAALLYYCCDAGGGTGRRSTRTFRRTSWRI
eukprot:COSAG01_NODE_1249_length_11069_cov_22.388332_12_plen_124_part_00